MYSRVHKLTINTFLIIATILICFPVVVRKLRERHEVGRLPLLEKAWFHAAVTWPIAVKGALGSFIFGANADSQTQFTLIVYGPGIGLGLGLLFARLRRGGGIYTPVLYLFALIALSLPNIFMTRPGLSAVLPILLLVAAFAVRRQPLPLEAWCRESLLAISLVAITVTSTAVIAPQNIIGQCREDKCTLVGQVLWSPLTNNGNFVGLSLVILMPWALARMRLIALVPATLGTLMMVELSGSRSALGAAIAVALILIGMRVGKRFRRFGAHMLLWAGVVASVVTALVGFDRNFATYRGGLWTRAREEMSNNPLFGSGPFAWMQLPDEAGFYSNYSPHNIWLEIGVSGGAVAILLIVLSGFALINSATTQNRDVFVLAIATLLLVGVLEAPVQPAKLGITPFAHLLPLVVGASSAKFSVKNLTPSIRKPALMRAARTKNEATS